MDARTEPRTLTRCSCEKVWKTADDGSLDFDIELADPFCTANHGGRL